MRITAITIFPEYFAPMKLSLIGKAIESNLISFKTVDLREFTTDNHRTVDDTPYGGGAGMVMKPEPWGEAIDAELVGGGEVLDLIILTPSGARFNQSKARELAASKNLVFACGRYEGIDARVAEHYKQVAGARVHEISIGDYVLNGGEVAALVIIEAITRLIPGVIGNPESLLEESHNEIGEVEYPVYTKPTIWRGLEVPEVLTSGNHGEIARWRREEGLRRSESLRKSE
ncbi:MAG: tRNA ((37)-N1)-methyltransferase TrmD [Actinomycetota bacterium]|jgi:tRNA (guanine37-N1)-methyltransferase|nr:tRNA (guanosine(37)-N1)-methyltransferase TrmD [Actinomycetota bacterium]NCX32663.1 tRNA (guanosine(37)-N1)-methyltransferase TrmD [Actinomycetota bacterium]NDH38003.1 tRNA (guanosine(37)-N1)-methyltransferase TrmD [Actinomycetota bacterium]